MNAHCRQFKSHAAPMSLYLIIVCVDMPFKVDSNLSFCVQVPLVWVVKKMKAAKKKSTL